MKCTCGSTKKVHDHRTKLRKYLARQAADPVVSGSAFGMARLEERAKRAGFKSLSAALAVPLHIHRDTR